MNLSGLQSSECLGIRGYKLSREWDFRSHSLDNIEKVLYPYSVFPLKWSGGGVCLAKGGHMGCCSHIKSFHCHAFGEIAGLVYVASFGNSHVV